LFRYLDEQDFRFSKRHATDADRFLQVCGMVAGRRLTWNHLPERTQTGTVPAGAREAFPLNSNESCRLPAQEWLEVRKTIPLERQTA